MIDQNENGICDLDELESGTCGPESCGPGTVWDEETQACIVAYPSDSNFDGCVQLNDLLDLLSAYGLCQTAEVLWSCGDPLEYQGYDYETVQIGEQCWFAENLRSENYDNGDAIPSGLSNSEWSSTSSGAIAVYPASASNLETYGRLYNWYAVDDARGLCPSGWHVPTDGEWITLEMVLGMSESEANNFSWRGTDEGTHMKADYGWSNGNGTNLSGFSGLPGGLRRTTGVYQYVGSFGYWWSSSQYEYVNGYRRLLGQNYEGISRYFSELRRGYSVRCVRDAE